jgi:hypothetical protein
LFNFTTKRNAINVVETDFDLKVRTGDMSEAPVFCLSGAWRSDSIDCRNNSSHEFTIDMAVEEFGIKFKRKTLLTISQVCREKEEILLTYCNEAQKQFLALSLEETNLAVLGGKTIYTIATSIGGQFESLVLTTLGNGDLRLREEYVLQDRVTLQVTSMLSSPAYRDAVVIRKYSRQAGFAPLLPPLPFVAYYTVNNWMLPRVCDWASLSALQVLVLSDAGCVDDALRVKVKCNPTSESI